MSSLGRPYTEREKAELEAECLDAERAGLAARLEQYLFDPSVIRQHVTNTHLAAMDKSTRTTVWPAYLEALRKSSAYIPVSCCLMTDVTGVNHCTHAPPAPIPWRRRLRWRVRSWWSGLRLRAGSWIAGIDLDEEEDDR